MPSPALICDWDCTLAEPRDRSFYGINGARTRQAIKEHFNLDDATLEALVAYQKEHGERAETAFFSPTLAARFNLASSKLGDYSALHRQLESIDTAGWFSPDPELVDMVRQVRSQFKLIILSNSSSGLITQIGKQIGFDVPKDFDALHTLTPQGGPPKYVDANAAFKHIISSHDIDPARSWSIGDSAKTDLIPALALGLRVGLIDNLAQFAQQKPDYPVGKIKDVLKLILK